MAIEYLKKPPDSAPKRSSMSESGYETSSPPSINLDAGYEILEWSGSDDGLHPYNWSRTRKWIVAGVVMLGSLILPLNGTAITIARESINVQFNIDDSHFPNSYWAVASWTLGAAIFIIIGLPLMEDLGVRFGYIMVYVFFFLMIIPQALAQNYTTLVLTRFFTGGCVALLANTIASIIPDIWEGDRDRSFPVALYILLYVMGTTLGPPIFATVVQYIDNWRWIVYIQLIIYGLFFPLFALLVKETRADVILRHRAKALRAQTGRPIYTLTEINSPPFFRSLWCSATRPIYLLFTEPVLFAAALWSAFSFGTVFLFTQSVEQVFVTLYGWPGYKTGYVQLAVVVGEIFGFLASLYNSRLYLSSASRNSECPGRPVPEARLYVSVFGSFLFMSGGMFVYAWTSYPTVPWYGPALGLVMVGCGIQIVVTAAADYVTDAYAASDYAGSAISAVAAVENVVAAFLPFSAQSMYTNLGFQWASTLLGLVALLLSFAPVVFIWKGRWFRERSAFMQAGNQRRENRFTSQSPGKAMGQKV